MSIFNLSIKKYGEYFFRIGIFLLPTALFISSLLFILSLIIGLFKNSSKKLFQQKWNFPFLVAGLIMILVCIIQNFFFNNINLISTLNFGTYSLSLPWIGLVNWVPFFLFFIGIQTYVKAEIDRKICIKLFFAGTIPVLITGFGQYWFDWYGPLSTLNNLIIWYQKSIVNEAGLTGLFSNSNYAGCWFSIIFPFSIVLFLDNGKNIFKKYISAFIIVCLGLSIFLTSSRSSLFGAILSTLILLGPRVFYFFIPLILFLIAIKSLNELNLIPNLFKQLINTFFKNSPYLDDTLLLSNDEFSRLDIYIFSLKNILKNPLIGLGPGLFISYIYLEKNVSINHTHNLFLELSFSYGMIVSLLVFINIFLILIYSYRKIFIKNNNFVSSENLFDKAWWTSFFILLGTQMVDVQYFDGRISFAFWILLAGLKQSLSKQNQVFALKK